jgi:hypothetical protein
MNSYKQANDLFIDNFLICYLCLKEEIKKKRVKYIWCFLYIEWFVYNI